MKNISRKKSQKVIKKLFTNITNRDILKTVKKGDDKMLSKEPPVKKILRKKFLKPKTKLRKERLKRELTTAYMANLIGLERRQYEMKEKGEYPFHDYEMYIIANAFKENEKDLFF